MLDLSNLKPNFYVQFFSHPKENIITLAIDCLIPSVVPSDDSLKVPENGHLCKLSILGRDEELCFHSLFILLFISHEVTPNFHPL